MKKQLPNRNEVPKKYTWDLSSIYNTEKEYEIDFIKTEELVNEFVLNHKDKIKNANAIVKSLSDYKVIVEKLTTLRSYISLHSSGDSIDESNQIRGAKASMRLQAISKNLSFYSLELKALDNSLLIEASKLSVDDSLYLNEIIEEKEHSLHPEVEKAFVSISSILGLPYQSYNRFKLADMKFNDFVVDGITYPNSFTLFENEYEYEKDVKVRREAYETFYSKLGEYNQGFATNYITHVQTEKAMSELRGYNSVFDYLLESQKVPKDFMTRQVDVIMDKLAPAMRKYAKLLGRLNGLEKMTYADLKINVDADFEPNVTIEESKELLLKGLSILGDDYLEIVRRSFDERWIDFPQNKGKSTGGFCSSPYGQNSFILLNWNGQMDEVMVLAHELGHAGHFQYANKYQSIFNTRPSLYFIEAPSTTNELIMSRHLANEAKDNRTKRWIKSVMISRTYYHNFVTHLLEAAFQKEVYERVDKKEFLSAGILNKIKLDIIKKFWADAVEIPDYAGLTWMRQPHYYMGLYPYTYSAGLTLGTKVSDMLFKNEIEAKNWIEVLKAGGTKSPLDLALMVGVDLSNDKALLEVIEFISQTIDEIISLSNI